MQPSLPRPQNQLPLHTWALLLFVGEQVIQRVFGDLPFLLLGRKTG